MFLVPDIHCSPRVIKQPFHFHVRPLLRRGESGLLRDTLTSDGDLLLRAGHNYLRFRMALRAEIKHVYALAVARVQVNPCNVRIVIIIQRDGNSRTVRELYVRVWHMSTVYLC